MTVGRQITEVLELHLGLGRSARRQRAIELLDSVGISSAAKRFDEYPHELSGGMRQRVTVAMALACGPRLLIADEPTTALDVTIQMQILLLLKRYQRETGMAMIFVSHDLSAVASVSDSIAVMYGGRIVEFAPTKRLLAEVRMPYTEALLKARPRLDAKPHTRLATLGGQPPDLIDRPSGCRFAPRCSYADASCWRAEPPLVNECGHYFACWKPLVGARQLKVTYGS